MPGIGEHLIAAFFSLIVVHAMHFKWEYSWAIFAGNFLPDIFKFGPSALVQGVWDVARVVQDPFYSLLNSYTSDPAMYFSVGFFVLGTTMTLFHFHHLSKKRMTEYDELYLFLLVGILTHLVMDVYIIESSIWW